MNLPKIKIKHLNLRSIYPVAIGFAMLLFLIGWIGMGSSSKLKKISTRARESGDDYTERLALALKIRETAAELISEARLARAPQDMLVPNPAFKPEFAEAKKRFQAEMEKGKNLWSKHTGPGTLSQEEVDAWLKVEEISQKFLEVQARMQNLKDQEARANEPDAKRKSEPPKAPAAVASAVVSDGQPPSEPRQDPHEQVGKVQGEFLEARIQLDKAAGKLTEAVTNVQKQIFSDFAAQEKQAAGEIDTQTAGTLLLGLAVVALTLWQARKQIVQLRQANRQEQEAKDFARSVFNSQSNDILVVSNKGELLQVNQAFLNHFDLSTPPEVSQDYRVALARLPEVATFVDKTLAQPDDSSNLRERLEVKSHDGDTRLFDVYTSPLTIGGQIEGRVVVILDVTEAEKVREELRRTRTLSAVGQITATVAHELYNPIGAVKLNLDLLEMQLSEGGDVKQVVARLKRGVEHLSTIVMDLRHLTRTRDPERQITDLNTLLDEVVELASDRLERSRVCVERNYSVELPQGEYDPQQLRKVFLNLLINAVEASPQNSGVELRTRYLTANGAPSQAKMSGAIANGAPNENPNGHANGPGGSLVVSVIDRGVGM
ncbi:MAG TPA: histidine kinase dimerization/phospho-acceptor domain-containing protein, partial [Blastocatellia bacterium]|nr:histidine kinase dimerization/phospho-acceptor domain-containing protein [Blastocatellia bacterium]